MIMLSSLLMLTTSIYLIYPPSLGNDTWRDLIYAYEITVSGRVRYTYHSPYPISFLSLIYSLISIVSGIELRWTTALYGFLYQFCLLISVFMLTRRLFHNDKAALLSTLIISISPNLMLWVYGPIPQIHALLLLTLLLLINVTTTNVDGVYMITTIFLLIAQIITHVVVALQTLTVFVGLYLLSKMLNYKYEEQGTFRTMLLCFLVSFTYWLMMYIIEYLLYGPIRNIYTLLVELFTEKAVSKAYSTSPATPPYVLFLVYSYFYIIPILTFVTWLTYDSREKTDGSGGKTTVYIETFFITSISFTSLGFLGNLFMPHLYLDRYLGIGAYILMGILSGYGLLKLSCKGKLGISLTVVVLVLIIASATVSGVFSPDYRPLGTTYASYSVSGPTNHNEYEIALTISEKLENGTLWVDYRYGQQLIFLAIQDPQSGIRKYEHLYRGIKVSGLEIMCIGSYGWKISSEDVKRFMSRQNSILIFREHAFEELLLSSEREKIKNYLHENTNIVFSTDKVKIFISL
ncbi:MAG: hypothetical protein DRO67_02220 [Candidatus Asgardarchaeum californiense]|nr:MAG: hypothetical protein DRO67_02220 [Candidatus Asgardarchaeum californiense]